jgi:hypothetical protein
LTRAKSVEPTFCVNPPARSLCLTVVLFVIIGFPCLLIHLHKMPYLLIECYKSKLVNYVSFL